MNFTLWFLFAAGLIIKETKKPLTEEEEREFGILAKVPNFTYWNLDKPVTEEDKLSKALLFTEIAREVSLLSRR